MARYIDADEMLKYLDESHTDNDWLVGQYNADWIYSFIEGQPTADVVEVVRCKDCKYWELKIVEPIFRRELGNCTSSQWENNEFWHQTWEDDFCSYGEKFVTDKNVGSK